MMSRTEAKPASREVRNRKNGGCLRHPPFVLADPFYDEVFDPRLNDADSSGSFLRNVEVASFNERASILHRHQNRSTIVGIEETEHGSEREASVGCYGGVVHIKPPTIGHLPALQSWSKPADLHHAPHLRGGRTGEGKEQDYAGNKGFKHYFLICSFNRFL